MGWIVRMVFFIGKVLGGVFRCESLLFIVRESSWKRGES